MFGQNKKQIKQLKQKKLELQQLKQTVEEKLEALSRMQAIMEEKTSKIDISDVYVFSMGSIHFIVKMDVSNIRGDALLGLERNVPGYHSTLVDIFNHVVVYEKASKEKIKREEYIPESSKYYRGDMFGYLIPIHEAEPNLLAYADRQVPLYVLQQLFYRFNHVNLDAPILKIKQNPNVKDVYRRSEK